MLNRLARIALLLFGATLVAPMTAVAQAWPAKPVRLIVPFPAAGTTDILARAIAQKLSDALGQQFVVENRPGAGGNIGADLVAKSAPDGYTMLMGTVGTQTINPSLYAKMPYEAAKDFAPVVLVAGVPNILVVNPGLPVHTVGELIKLAKEKPGTINFASSGNGTSIHLSGELFRTMTGVQIAHVPYKGSAPALTDLVGGQVQIMFDNLPSALGFVKSGKLRAVAVTSGKRAPALPDVPTIAESGVPGFEASSWFGILAPAGTPREIVQKVNAEANKALQSAEMKDKLLSQGAEAVGNTPEFFADYIKAETVKWAKVVKESGAKVD